MPVNRAWSFEQTLNGSQLGFTIGTILAILIYEFRWAACAAWHWGSGPRSEGGRTSMVWTRGTLQWCSRGGFWRAGWWGAWAWGGPGWHGGGWWGGRGGCGGGGSQLSALVVDVRGDLVWDPPCSKPAIWKGAHWCGCCPCTCTLIKNPIMIMIWWVSPNLQGTILAIFDL